ncbi:MAG TPA: hypothetical protein VGI10_03300 [Polyangiaceae bacterium]
MPQQRSRACHTASFGLLIAALLSCLSAACSSSHVNGDSAASAGETGVDSGICVAGDPTFPSQCTDATHVNGCQDTGKYALRACTDVCGEVGLTSKGCAQDNCQCDKRTDDACDIGAKGYCACSPCQGSDELNAYINCYLDDPPGTKSLVQCYMQYVDAQGNVDCTGAKVCGN